jgi:hypothetical protein
MRSCRQPSAVVGGEAGGGGCGVGRRGGKPGSGRVDRLVQVRTGALRQNRFPSLALRASQQRGARCARWGRRGETPLQSSCQGDRRRGRATPAGAWAARFEACRPRWIRALGRHEVEPGRELRRQRARALAPVKQLRHRGPPREVGAEIANQWRGGNHGRKSTPGGDNPGPGVESARERALTQKVNACIFLSTSPARGQSP